METATGGAEADVFQPNCPSRLLLDHVTSRWAVLVLLALSRGTMRWGELRRQLRGVTDKMLAQTLHTLEGDRLVSREAHPEVPPRVEYSLTEPGRDLTERLLPLVDWITDHVADTKV